MPGLICIFVATNKCSTIQSIKPNSNNFILPASDFNGTIMVGCIRSLLQATPLL